MPQVQTVVKFTHKDIVDLISKAASEQAGPNPGGGAVVKLIHVTSLEDLGKGKECEIEASVTFNRTGKTSL